MPGRRFKDSCVSRGPRGRPRGGRPREGGHVRTCPRPRRSLPARPPGRRGVPPCLPLRRGARKAVARGLRLPRLRRLVARPVPPNPPSDRRHPRRTLGWGEGRPRGAEEVHGPGRGRGSAAEPPQPAARPAAAPLSRAPGPTPQRRPRLLGHGPPCGLFLNLSRVRWIGRAPAEARRGPRAGQERLSPQRAPLAEGGGTLRRGRKAGSGGTPLPTSCGPGAPSRPRLGFCPGASWHTTEKRPVETQTGQLLAVDHSARASMKNAASCEN